MPDGIHITLTINLKDGGEVCDLEAKAPTFDAIPDIVRDMIARQGFEEGDWSSLVIVVVPE